MKRTKRNKKADLILCSDMHLREDTPTCWTGDFQEEQWNSVQFISDLQVKHDCIVLHAGDLFHHWKPSPWLLSMAMQHLPQAFYTVYGQHDLPQHNTELMSKSGLHTLDWAGVAHVLTQCHYGQTPTEKGSLLLPNREPDIRILVWHHMTYITPPFPGAKEGQAEGILRKYPQFDLIVTGDNHQSFVTTYKGRLLVNPGNLTRQKADQINYKPRVALWYADTNTIKWEYLPIQEGVITREHIDNKKERDQHIEAFISRLNTDWEASLSFKDNLRIFFSKNKVKDEIKQIIYKSIE